MKKYIFEVWIHPEAGDDECGEITVKGNITLAQAKKKVEQWLAKRSEITTDYRLLKEC